MSDEDYVYDADQETMKSKKRKTAVENNTRKIQSKQSLIMKKGNSEQNTAISKEKVAKSQV